MSSRAEPPSRTARRPPAGLPGLDARFSRVLQVPGAGADAGHTRGWHVLDNGPELERLGRAVVGTTLAVHGNPTWSYLWRDLVRAATAQAEAGGSAWRVIAVDQLEMGFSERTGVQRNLRQRVADLGALTDAMGRESPVVTHGHDSGRVNTLGLALAHPEAAVGHALCNTAEHHDDGEPIPLP